MLCTHSIASFRLFFLTACFNSVDSRRIGQQFLVEVSAVDDSNLRWLQPYQSPTPPTHSADNTISIPIHFTLFHWILLLFVLSKNGWRPAHIAARDDASGEKLKLIIDAWPSCIDLQDDHKHTPLITAALFRNVACVKVLLLAGCDQHLKIKHVRGAGRCENAVHAAVVGNGSSEHGNTKDGIECLKLLIAAECNIGLQNEKGFVPLHYAVAFQGKQCNLDYVKVLLAGGCDVHIKNSIDMTKRTYAQGEINNTALMFAEKYGHGECSAFLEKL